MLNSLHMSQDNPHGHIVKLDGSNFKIYALKSQVTLSSTDIQ